ncbi:MAG: lytic transglycosylase domain-containing protein [Desulfomonilaceae bacterium]|jgi:hypothetical protein
MARVAVPIIGTLLLVLFPIALRAEVKIQANGIAICSVIINEMTEGKIPLKQSRDIATAIAGAGNRHFGKVTCGDMWLYMAMVYVESGFRNNIINHQNCRGMFQIHAPSWASKFGVKYRDLLNLETNADCGVQVLKYYLGLYRDLGQALSAYNSDHPAAARGYARMVMSVRNKIKKRYAQLYHTYKDAPMLVARTPDR